LCEGGGPKHPARLFIEQEQLGVIGNAAFRFVVGSDGFDDLIAHTGFVLVQQQALQR
jgi:hypothetical protein